MKKHKPHSRKRFLRLFLCALVLASCATSPDAGTPDVDGAPDFAILPSGANLYLWADAINAKPLLEAIPIKGLSAGDASQILDRTKTVMAAFFPAPETDDDPPSRRFFIAGWGNYPNLRAGISMTFSRYWKKIKSQTGSRYWFNNINNIGIALGSKLAFVSDGDPFIETEPQPNAAPFGFDTFVKPCVFAGWLNNPSAYINNIMTGMGIPVTIPIEELFFGLILLGEGDTSAVEFEPEIRLKTPSTSHAIALSGLFAIARAAFGAGFIESETPAAVFAQLLSNPPVRDGTDIVINAPPMDAGEIALLFNAFSTL